MSDIREPFEDSRRLTGCNLYFPGTGAALESARSLAFDDAAPARWRDNIAAARRALGWPEGDVYARRHASGVSLAFAAPIDQLYAATEVAEWAWYDALGLRADPDAVLEGVEPARAHAAALPRAQALEALGRRAGAEANPALRQLDAAARARGVPLLWDDDEATLGLGESAATWAMCGLPVVDAVDWASHHAIPLALVTGSNGKTTTVRLLAALLRAQGLHVAHSCTEGVYFDNALVEGGDFSGPGGARTALRQPAAQAAVLETARGGLLRRGLALCRADVAVVTNISADHYGEYGVHGLDDLAAAKLVVARAVEADGLLVLNADDPVLRRQGARHPGATGWFAADFDDAFVLQRRAAGEPTCGVRDGRLLASAPGGEAVDLGPVEGMPIALGGRAAYNVANIAAAALAARRLGVPDATVRERLAVFGTGAGDNPGRLQGWTFGDARVVIDYAHNPEGFHGLMRAVGASDAPGRVAVVLGHAGNREDDDLRAVAATVAGYRPARVVLKDIRGYERGRAPGEIAAIMRAALVAGGVPEPAIETRLDEVDAARALLQDMRDDAVVVLPLHEVAARDEIARTLDAMRARQWRPGDPLPDRAPTQDGSPDE